MLHLASVAALSFTPAAQRPFFGSSDAELINAKSVLATLRGFGATPPPGGGALLERGSRLAHARSAKAGEDPRAALAPPPGDFEYVAAHEPCVPALCLTSEEDSVIKADGVRAYAAELRAAQPSRDVRVTVLKGSHVAIAHSDGKRYEAAIVELLVRCGFPERVT